MNEEIIKKNLKLMLSGAMADSESMGGSAGTYKEGNERFPCSAANFYYDDNGEIVVFTNDVEPPRKGLWQGMFRIANNFKAGKTKIVLVQIGTRPPKEAQDNIRMSAVQYNKVKGW